MECGHFTQGVVTTVSVDIFCWVWLVVTMESVDISQSVDNDNTLNISVQGVDNAVYLDIFCRVWTFSKGVLTRVSAVFFL